jgi:ankyrin repeat protein
MGHNMPSEERDIDARLFRACGNGDPAKVEVLLAHGANPNAVESNGWTPLLCPNGISKNALAIVKLLVAKGANVNYRQPGQGWTPLTQTINNQEPVDVVRFLIQHGADPNASTSDGTTPLHLAARNGSIEVATELLAHGARVDARTNYEQKRGPNSVVDSPQLEVQNTQMDRYFEPGFHFSGQTPLFEVAKNWNPKMAALLIKHGAKLSTTDDNGWTLLHWATEAGVTQAIYGLAALGADVNAASKLGFRPLHVAMHVGFGFASPHVIRVLVSCGANPSLRNSVGQTPMDLLRSDAHRWLANPDHEPQYEMTGDMRQRYLVMANEARLALDPKSKPISDEKMQVNPNGTHYSSLSLFDLQVERTVRVVNQRAVLELKIPAGPKTPSAVTFTAVSLENFDTLTPLPFNLNLSEGNLHTARFEFPAGAAIGGSVDIEYKQKGPGDASGSGSLSDMGSINPSFSTDQNGRVSITHDIEGRTLILEIIAVKRIGKTVPGLGGRVLKVTANKPAQVVGLIAMPDSRLSTSIAYRFRLLPNTKWHNQRIALP